MSRPDPAGTEPPAASQGGGRIEALRLPRVHRQQMLAHLRAVYPLEGCGLLAGREGRVCAVHPIANRLRSAQRFEMAPAEQVRVMLSLEAAGRDLLAIYHSHPRGTAYPSPADVAGAHYPDALYLVVSLADPTRPIVRAFAIGAPGIDEVAVEIV